MKRPIESRCARAAAACVLFGLVLVGMGARADDLPPYDPDPNAEREAVPEAYRWDLSPLFESEAQWEQSLQALTEELDALRQFQGTLAEPAQLLACLDAYFDLHDRTNHVTLYANLLHNIDTASDRYASMEGRSLALMDELMREASFLRTELLALGDDEMQRAYEARPELEKHRSYLGNLRRRRSRVLEPEAERVLGLLGDNLWAEIDLNEIPSSLEDAFGALLTDIAWPIIHDEEGQEVQMTLASYPRLRASSQRAVRAEAVDAFLKTLHDFRHAFAATLGGQCEFDVALARARGYDRAIEAYLDKDGLSVGVYDNLISTINANLDVLHRYVNLRKRVMGVEAVRLYDLYVPLTQGVESEIAFDEARRMIVDALAPLGETYGALLREGLDPLNGWIDVYPNATKRSGAFSASVYGRHPYVFMNFQNSLDDMSTLAHEYGHAIHSHLAMEHQPYSAFRYVPFLAEIASTCNEALLSNYLVDRAESDAQRAALLVERAETIRTTIFRQTLFAEFEREAHRFVENGVPVTADLLSDTYADLVRRYYGPDYELGDHDGMEWAYVPHFYYKFYVFNYATGLSSGLAIAEKIRRDGAPAVEGLLAMLSGGCSEPPLELLKRAGVDLTEPAPIGAAVQVFGATLDELERLLAPADSR